MPDEQPVDPTDAYMQQRRAWHEAAVAGLATGPPPQPPVVQPDAAAQAAAIDQIMAAYRARMQALEDARTWGKP
jgi:hypothetical protein